MKILFIGNSFSQDANAHLYSLCKAAGVDAEFLNMIIGGCSFQMHAECIEKNLPNYMIQYNGHDYFETLFTILDYGMKYRDWDYVSIQQVSGDSGDYSTFHPYCDSLIEKIREECPRAKLLLHRTWAYDHSSNHFAFPKYESSPTVMSERIGEAYAKLSEDTGGTVIPVGEVIEALRAMPEFDIRRGGVSLHRDGFHLGYGYGRYAAAAVWYQAMGLGDITENDFFPVCEAEDDERLYKLIREVVGKMVKPVIK